MVGSRSVTLIGSDLSLQITVVIKMLSPISQLYPCPCEQNYANYV